MLGPPNHGASRRTRIEPRRVSHPQGVRTQDLHNNKMGHTVTKITSHTNRSIDSYHLRDDNMGISIAAETTVDHQQQEVATCKLHQVTAIRNHKRRTISLVIRIHGHPRGVVATMVVPTNVVEEKTEADASYSNRN